MSLFEQKDHLRDFEVSSSKLLLSVTRHGGSSAVFSVTHMTRVSGHLQVSDHLGMLASNGYLLPQTCQDGDLGYNV